jgi:hypothetical protein
MTVKEIEGRCWFACIGLLLLPHNKPYEKSVQFYIFLSEIVDFIQHQKNGEIYGTQNRKGGYLRKGYDQASSL